MYITKDTTREKVIAVLADQVSDFHDFVEYFRDWIYRKSIPPEVEEHILRAESELKIALSYMIRPRKDEKE